MEWRIKSISDVIEARYDEELKRRELVLSFSIGVLSFISVRRLFMKSLNPPH
ncbi:MAG: hypothetical protein QW552_09160 [Ignisphaera sp.]